MIKEVTNGVWLIYCDFYERFVDSGMGADSDGWYSIYFGDDEDILIEVKFKPPIDGHLFGELCKKTYHGTFYTYDVYEQLLIGDVLKAEKER